MYAKAMSKEERREKNREKRSTFFAGLYLFLAGGLCGYSLCLYQLTLKEAEALQQKAAVEKAPKEEERKPGLMWRVLESRLGG